MAANRWQTSCMCGVTPKISWTTRTTGNGPAPSGSARYAGMSPIRIQPASGAMPRLSHCPLLLMAGLVVLLQQVVAEIARQIAPHRMNVIGVVLRVVVL